MAIVKTEEVTALTASSTAAGIVPKSQYRGNVQVITVTHTATINQGDVIHLTETLPQEARIIGLNLFVAACGSSATLDIGLDSGTEFNNDLDVSSAATSAFPKAGQTAGYIAAGGKKVTIVAGSAGSYAGDINGYILIATNE